jgi:sugar fermentation stimulation protein A
MKYGAVTKGIFLERPNRFIARVMVNGEAVICHVKNTGRCRELLVPGATVYLAAAENPHRKTDWDLIAVEKGTRLINMDAQAPNKVFAEFAQQFEAEARAIHPEFTVGRSRLDFGLELPDGSFHYIEVKGVTLEQDGHAHFPDAPTERGVKHLRELTEAVKEGYRAVIAFVIQMDGVTEVLPHRTTDPAFGEALDRAAEAGVRILCLPCHVEPDRLEIVSGEI